jgi:hypothetical protein
MDFVFDANITASEYSDKEKDLIIEGTLVDTSTNENGWAVPVTELDSLTEQANARKQIRVDHSKNYRDIVGWVEGGVRNGDIIRYKGRVHDPIVQRIIARNPTAHHVSIGARASSITCSNCGKPSRPFKTCKCKNAHDIVAGLQLKEVSFITDPAYENTLFQPMGFSAAITASINSFSPREEYNCNLSPLEEKICERIKNYNPGTMWNLAAARELAPVYTNSFIKNEFGDEVLKRIETGKRSEKQMAEIKAHDQFPEAPGGKNIPYRKDVPQEQQFEQHMKEGGPDYKPGPAAESYLPVAPGGTHIPFGHEAPGEKQFEQTMHEDEAKREDEDETKRETLGKEYGTNQGHASRGGLHGTSGGGPGPAKPSTYTNTKREDEDELRKREDEVRHREDEVRRREDELRRREETLGKEYGTAPSHSGRGGLPSGGNGGSDPAPSYNTKHEDEVRKEDKDKIHHGGSEAGGGDAVLVISQQMEEFKHKLEEAVKKFEEFHEDDEAKREDDAVHKVARQMEEMGKKLEELVKREEVFHKRKEDEDEAKKEDEDEAKKEDEDEDEAKKEDESKQPKKPTAKFPEEAASKKKVNVGARVVGDKSSSVTASTTLAQDAFNELLDNLKSRKPEWSLPQ